MRGFMCPGIAMLVAVAASERESLLAGGGGIWAARFARSASARAETTFTPSRNRAWSRRRVRSSTSQRTSSWGRPPSSPLRQLEALPQLPSSP